MLLQYGMYPGRTPALPQIPLRRPRAPPVDLHAIAIVIPTVDPEFPSRALPRCRPACCEPIRPRRGCVLRVQQTIEIRLPGRVRARHSAELDWRIFRPKSISEQPTS